MPREQYEIRWKDYYLLLGVRPDADQDTIRRIYRRLIQLYHPDIAGVAVDQERVTELNEANEVLSDPERRTRYDQAYRSRGNQAEPPPGASTYEESEDWDEPEWDTTWDSPPIPHLMPDHVDLGLLEPTEQRSVTFQPENLGGPAARYELTYYPDEPWLSATMKSDTFPCPIYVTINPCLLHPGRRYTAELRLALDGVTTSARIRFQVAGVASSHGYFDEYEVEEPSEGWASDLAYHFPPFRLLESLADKISPRADETQRVLPWPSWRWQRLALMGSVPMALFFILVSLPAAAWAIFVLSFAWLAVTFYAGIATGWLRASRDALPPARIAGGTSIVVSGLTYTLAIVTIILYIVFMVLAFRLASALLKEWLEKQK